MKTAEEEICLICHTPTVWSDATHPTRPVHLMMSKIQEKSSDLAIRYANLEVALTTTTTTTTAANTTATGKPDLDLSDASTVDMNGVIDTPTTDEIKTPFGVSDKAKPSAKPVRPAVRDWVGAADSETGWGYAVPIREAAEAGSIESAQFDTPTAAPALIAIANAAVDLLPPQIEESKSAIASASASGDATDASDESEYTIHDHDTVLEAQRIREIQRLEAVKRREAELLAVSR